MQVVYRDFPIYTEVGDVAEVLNGTFDASPMTGQQPGWYALRRVKDDGSLDGEIVANVHIVSVTT